MSDLVILTRPKHRNVALANRLKDDAVDVACLPALRLKPLAIPAAQMPWPQDYDLVVFVSSHAAQSYLDRVSALCPEMRWPDHVRAATVGFASAEPLYQAGHIASEQIFHPDPASPNQDSEGLWKALQPVMAQIKRVLIVRGQAGREWLGAQFERLGIQVTRLSLYQREPEVWTGDQAGRLADALLVQRPTIFLLTSSESVDAVYANMQRLDLMPQWAECRFITIHERISDRLHTILRSAGLQARHPITVCAPNDDAICQAIHLSASNSGSL